MKTTENDPGLVLRWHISRIYEDMGSGPADRQLDVTVQQGTPLLDEAVAERGIAALQTETEELDWWSNEAPELVGWLWQDVLLRGLGAGPGDGSETPRQLAEDMVVVQQLAEPDAWERALEDQEASTDHLDLAGLATAPGSVWVDYTQAARRAAKARYKRVSGESLQPEGAWR